MYCLLHKKSFWSSFAPFSLALASAFSLASMFLFLVLISPLTSQKVYCQTKNSTSNNLIASPPELNLYFFWQKGCPHCAEEELFLEELKKDFSNIHVYSYEISENRKNALLLQKVGRKLEANVSGVPFLVIGDKSFSGFSREINSAQIRSQIENCSANKCPDPLASIPGLVNPSQDNRESGPSDRTKETSASEKDTQNVSVPLLGEVNLRALSLPILSILLGLLDGFNPCAMWVLLFLISMLLGMENRKSRWILGLVFIISSALVYFLFMSAWLNLILFLGYLTWVRAVIGVVAVLGGTYSLRTFLVVKDTGCEVAGEKKRQKVFEKITQAVSKKNLLLASLGLVTLAFMVNLIELVCSAGFPAIFTQILTLNKLPIWQYYLFILVYIFFFMLDDMLIFGISMFTLEMVGVTTKYSKFSRLVGGILMLAIGILMILKPELLTFH